MARETEDKFVVRTPLDLHGQLKQEAAHNYRSANSGIVYRLEYSNELEKEFAWTNRTADKLFTRN